MIGVDIGTTSIKIVELMKDKRLLNYGILETSGYLERFNTAIQTSTLNLFEQEAVNYLRILLGRMKLSGKEREVIVSLPSFAAFTTLIEMPVMSEADTIKTMGIHVKRYVPIPISSATLDWLKVGELVDEEGNKKQQLFLIAVATTQIENYKRIFKAAGLKLIALEIEGLSLARILSLLPSQGKNLIVDIGSRSTALSVIENGFLKFSSQTDFAGASLTQSLASGLNIAARRAEQLKRQKGLSAMNSGAERELSTQLLPILDVIINEAKRVADSHLVKAVVLSGGGANLLGIEKYFSHQIGLPVSKIDALSAVGYSENLEAIRGNLGPVLAVAIGLALRN